MVAGWGVGLVAGCLGAGMASWVTARIDDGFAIWLVVWAAGWVGDWLGDWFCG